MEKRNSGLTQVAILAISILLTSATAINGALPQMRASLSMTTTQGELVATVPSLGVVIFVVLSSLIAKKIGIKRTVQIGLLLVGFGGIAPIFLVNYPLIIMSRFILGAGFGLFNSLAVSIINILYRDEENRRANMLGFRGAAENIGSAVMTIAAGILLSISWKLSFGIYAIAFFVLIVFTLFVPEITDKTPNKMNHKDKEKINMTVFLLALFALFLVMTFVAIGVRFPAMVTSMRGGNYNASNLLAVMPIIGIITGFFFGRIYQALGEKCLHLGLILLAVATLLIGISAGNFPLLLIGYFISGIPGSLIFPFIYNSLNKYAPASKMNVVTSIILIGCNLGSFLAPFGLNLLQKIGGSESIFTPFIALSTIILGILMIFVIRDMNILQRKVDKTE
ncbi:MFS transporter [Dellaglioa carnosa]|uniref:MFS transporter n=1 Tax=Dellaglioa carnosa TaxID=2995136 RepID=UPI0022A8801D|nr:MFS transporter [Dellaglioa carnosa]MCZ2493285.1 MFS transporter [Dellaglioa carnosa]